MAKRLSTRRRRRTGWALVLATVVGAGAARAAEAPGPAASATPEATSQRGQAYARLMRSFFAARRGEYRGAYAEMRQAIALEPGSIDLRMQAAGLLLSMGRRDEAESLAREALELDVDNVDALRFIADRARERAIETKSDVASHAEALRLFKKLQDLGVEDEQLLRSLTQLQLQGGDREAALAVLERLVRLYPGDQQATRLYAQLLLDRGRGEAALQVLLDFVVRHPAETELPQLCEELAGELDAWALVDEILARAPEAEAAARGAGVRRLHALALTHLSKMEQASRAWEAILAAAPDDRAARRNLARAYRALGRLAEAAVMARNLARDEPADGLAHLLLAETLDRQGDAEGALEAFRSALSVYAGDDEGLPTREAIRDRMADLYLDRGDVDRAQEVLEHLEQPERTEALLLRAAAAIALEDWAAARQAVRRLRAAGQDRPADLVEAEILIRTGQAAKAEPRIVQALGALGPGARVRIAEVYFEARQGDPGVTLLRQWVEAEPRNADAHYALGSLLYRMDRFAEAEGELRRAFELDPNHAPALNFLGYSLGERGERLGEALELVERALRVDPWNGAYLDSLGWILVRMGRFAEAREPLERAAREHPKDAVVLEHLGDLYHQLGEDALALATWKRALDGKPEDRDALRSKIETGANSGRAPQIARQPAPDAIDRAAPPRE